MNIQSLRYFTTVANLENISKAAKLLNVSQSAMSKTIAGLEKELGTPLFYRNGKHLKLNDSGVMLLERCTVILNELDGIQKNLSRQSSDADNQIKIWSYGIPAPLLELLIGFRKEFPQTNFIINHSQEPDPLPDINTYDLIIYPDELKFSKFKGTDFFTRKYYLAISASKYQGNKAFVNWKSLDGYDFVFIKEPGVATDFTYSTCKALNVNMNSCSFADSLDMQHSMIAAGLGVGFIARDLSYSEKNDSRIVLLPFMDGRLSQKIKMCFKRDKHLSPLGLTFKNYITEHTKEENSGHHGNKVK